ncbi:hypothetical protein EHW67_16165 [Arenibacter aquaticus]|uniref:Uncharacterized protein n=1 Tax=Arenibacter aquaticus TaxID=2489054 RepID=A0A3S0C439_9FLAO|nr:hypothetical protein [Arenibacter aquaticus]RTE51745.1 hypothetical protein EHW67_16165 [Arenibacter aquaticus]
MLKKLGKILLGLLLLVLISAGILYALYHEPLPQGVAGKEADALATKMLTALNHEAYKEARYLEWSFVNGKHHYKWDKVSDTVLVSWKDYQVSLDLKNSTKSTAKKGNKRVTSDKEKQLIKKATSYFNNDSFWLVAPYKVFDKGTIRSIVHLENGEKGLMVTYTSGGDTPGDSYVWLLQPNGFPISFRMWVNIIPIGGLEAGWDTWQVTESGAFLPVEHQLGPVTLEMGSVRAYR